VGQFSVLDGCLTSRSQSYDSNTLQFFARGLNRYGRASLEIIGLWRRVFENPGPASAFGLPRSSDALHIVAGTPRWRITLTPQPTGVRVGSRRRGVQRISDSPDGELAFRGEHRRRLFLTSCQPPDILLEQDVSFVLAPNENLTDTVDPS